jgi:hypothetical protein
MVTFSIEGMTQLIKIIAIPYSKRFHLLSFRKGSRGNGEIIITSTRGTVLKTNQSKFVAGEELEEKKQHETGDIRMMLAVQG